MARIDKDSIVHGFLGMVGNLVFKLPGNKTYVAQMPKINNKQRVTEQQMAARSCFKISTEYALNAIKNQ